MAKLFIFVLSNLKLVKVIEYGNRSKKTPSSIDTKVTLNEKLVNHKLEVCPNGVYQIKFFPTETGVYNVFFYKGGKKIDGKILI